VKRKIHPEQQAPAPEPAGAFAQNYHELADALRVSRKSVQNWRSRSDLVNAPDFPQPRADGRHSIEDWRSFMIAHCLARSDEDETSGEFPEGSVTDWKKRREQLMCVKLEREIDRQDGKLLVASELEVPIGATFMAIQTKLSQFPERAAKRVTGFTDVQEVEARLREEMDGDLGELHAAEYLEILESTAIPFDEQTEELYRRVSFDGQDRDAFCELARLLAREVLRKIGNKVINAITEAQPEEIETPADENASNQCKIEPVSCKKLAKMPVERAISKLARRRKSGKASAKRKNALKARLKKTSRGKR
jgi:hypothetical protein